jgi:anti-sigma factor RsiW
MNDTKTGTTTHLAAEARERIGMGGEPGPGESRHLASCERCRREIAEIGSLQERFAALVVLVPSTGFANRVMARVQLPAPRWSRALAGLRTHPSRVAAIAATTVAALVGTFVWLTTYPQVTPGVMARLVYERGSGLVWQGVVAVGRVVYDSGLATLIGAFRADLNAWSAVGALATLTLVGMVSMWMLLRLMEVSPSAIRTGVRRIG